MWAFFSFSFQFAFTRLGEGIECEAKQKEKKEKEKGVGELGREERPGWLQRFLTITQAGLELGGSWGAIAGE